MVYAPATRTIATAIDGRFGDQVAVMLPNYLQTWGLAQNFGAQVRSFMLHAGTGWEPDGDEVRRAIAPGTKLVVVTNPHNPTGHVLSAEMRRVIVGRAAEVGAWLLADEVYQGAERDGVSTTCRRPDCAIRPSRPFQDIYCSPPSCCLPFVSVQFFTRQARNTYFA